MREGRLALMLQNAIAEALQAIFQISIRSCGAFIKKECLRDMVGHLS